MGYFEDRRPRWGAYGDEEFSGGGEIFKADGRDDCECHFYERMENRRYAEPEAGFYEMNIIYPFIDRHLKTKDWTRQDDGSFVFNINGKNALISPEDGEILAVRWDGVQVYISSLYSLEEFLL